MLTVDELFKLHDELCGAGKAIMESKNHDYRGGSGDPLANFRGSKTFDIEPITGILLRVQDKMMRIKTFAEKGQLQVKGEGVKDALIDVINYMVLIGGFIKELQASQSMTVEALHTPDPSSYNMWRNDVMFDSLCRIPPAMRGETPDLGDEAHPEI